MAIAAGVRLPLWHAWRMFELEADEYDALVVALLVECDARVGWLVYLNDHVAQARLTVGPARARAELHGIPYDALRRVDRPVLADGLLTLEGGGPAAGARWCSITRRPAR